MAIKPGSSRKDLEEKEVKFAALAGYNYVSTLNTVHIVAQTAKLCRTNTETVPQTNNSAKRSTPLNEQLRPGTCDQL